MKNILNFRRITIILPKLLKIFRMIIEIYIFKKRSGERVTKRLSKKVFLNKCIISILIYFNPNKMLKN